jgi:hypothetical protein
MERPYNSMRSSSTPGGSFTYNLTVLPGNYTVTLKFIEPRPDQTAGLRLMNVSINGTAVLTRFDLFATAGALTPYSVSFAVTTTGAIQITLAAVAGNAILSGIQIDEVGSTSVAAGFRDCEVEFGAGYQSSLDQALSGNMFSGVYSAPGCWNRTGGVRLVSAAACRSDVDGQTLDITARGHDGNVRSLLTSPIVCTPTGAEGTMIPGADYADADVITFVFTVTVLTGPTPTTMLAVVTTKPPA